ncbi:DUF3017 domain-containing protein [Leekyejoonella antrihumi]|uniref:DUF3017 domain-containing protein n=1 Tax=Leekyejoonella antrihumi TaxID=1660198 RepID=A0A563DR44_9MICO|nr:DUF3017 domain-containing protein [Leekyejoonella antrihumi]TWP32717.1 DUF3017 domain-containing protein [Leekyejoonella antrihumi]
MTPARLGPAWWVVMAGCLVGGLTMLFGSFRLGGYLVAASLVVGALERAVLPESMVAGLGIRSRWVDVFFYLAGAAALVVVFAEVQLGPAY